MRGGGGARGGLAVVAATEVCMGARGGRPRENKMMSGQPALVKEMRLAIDAQGGQARGVGAGGRGVRSEFIVAMASYCTVVTRVGVQRVSHQNTGSFYHP